MSQKFFRTLWGLSQDFLRTFLELSKDFLRTYSELFQDFLRTFQRLSKDFAQDFPRTFPQFRTFSRHSEFGIDCLGLIFSRVSKCHRHTNVRPRKNLLTLPKIFRFVRRNLMFYVFHSIYYIFTILTCTCTFYQCKKIQHLEGLVSCSIEVTGNRKHFTRNNMMIRAVKNTTINYEHLHHGVWKAT